jgi:drug/metabolite transporter (DMT)-like permease
MKLFLLALVVAGTSLGDLWKTIAMKQHGAIEDFRPQALAGRLGRAMRTRWLVLSVAAYAVSFFAFMGLVSVAELSFAVPATAAAYVIETLLARWVLKETVSRRRWTGAVIVAAGVVLVSL